VYKRQKNRGDLDFEVTEYPEQTRFRATRTAGVRQKLIVVPRTAVYRITARNTANKERLCHLHVQRLPAGAHTRDFPTGVRWVERYDTIVLNTSARMEERPVRQVRRSLVRTDTSVVNLLERTERVYARRSLGRRNTSTIQARLPDPVKREDLETELVSWAYWIGVGDEAEAQYQEANRLVRLAKTAAKTAVDIGLIASGYGALAALALEGVSFFVNPAKGDNVLFRINGGETLLDQGDAIAAYARVDNYRQGELSIELNNDNFIDAINVQVRLVAVVLNRHYHIQEYYETRRTPVWDTEIKLVRIPVPEKEGLR
jgi:hypothetical protein